MKCFSSNKLIIANIEMSPRRDREISDMWNISFHSNAPICAHFLSGGTIVRNRDTLSVPSTPIVSRNRNVNIHFKSTSITIYN